MNDQDFDALFKRAAEQHRVPYNPSAWEKMRRKLDRASGTLGSTGKITVGIILLLLGGIVGVSWWGGEPAQVQRIEIATPIKSESVADEPASLSPPMAQRQAGTEQVTLSKEIHGAAQEEASSRSVTGSSSEAGASDFVEAYIEGLSPFEGVGYLQGNPVREEIAAPGQPSVNPVPMAEQDIEQSIVPAGKRSVPLRWRVSLGVSPDISAISLGEATQVGSKAAVGLEYFLLPRLSVQTGIIFSNKVYNATGESYKPYPGYWKQYPMPNSIDAQCDVLDIPINLRYYAITMPKSSIFVSGGVSSYLMLTEDYVYRYRGQGYQKPYDYEHHERNQNRHYFKVANMSLGYERSLSKRWALQVEPFVKIPVAGVGFGKIKLSTTGVFMSLNYRIH